MSDEDSELNYSYDGSFHGDNSEVNSVSDSEQYAFEDNFLPYQDEPLASTEDEGSDEEHHDEDGISRDVLEQRYERQIPIEQW